MDVIYLKGELSLWIIQHNLFTYILPHSIFKRLANLICLSVALWSVLQTTIKMSKMNDNVNYYKYKWSTMKHYRISPTHPDWKGAKGCATGASLNWYTVYTPEKCTASTIHTTRINHIWNFTPESLFKWSAINAVAGKTAFDPQGYPLLAIIQQKRHGSSSLDPCVHWRSNFPNMILLSGFTLAVELIGSASLFICLHSPSISSLSLLPVGHIIILSHQSSSFLPFQRCCLYDELISYCAGTSIVLFNSTKVIYLNKHLNLMTLWKSCLEIYTLTAQRTTL